MATLDDLEAELTAAWNPQTLSIYADHLQSIGDPRGELIALDLHDPDGARERRGELLRAWMGDSLPLRFDGEWSAGDAHTRVTFDRGACELAFDGELAMLGTIDRFFASRPARYLRRVRIVAAGDVIAALVDLLAAEPRPWLRHLLVERDEHQIPLAVDDAAPLVAATPNLELLELRGSRIFGDLPHPNIRELQVKGHDAMDLHEGTPMPRVRIVDFAFDHVPPMPERILRRIITPRQFPATRELRFWREEPGHFELFPDLDEIPMRATLERLVLPSLRSAEDVRHVQSALDEMPALRQLVVARSYAEHAGWASELRHPSARIVLPEVDYPWPAPDGITELAFDNLAVSLDALVDLCETHYDDDELVRAAWDAIWDAVRASRGASGAWLGLAMLHRAIVSSAPCDDWQLERMRHKLRMLDPDVLARDTVRVRWFTER